MTIHETVYETIDLTDEEAFEIIGGPNIENVIKRRERMREFLSENEWSVDAYTAWSRGSVPVPTARTVVKSLGKAVSDVVQHGIKFASKEEKERRMEACMACEHLHEMNRCKVCGCFVDYKTQLEAWHCPLKRW